MVGAATSVDYLQHGTNANKRGTFLNAPFAAGIDIFSQTGPIPKR
jgi:hypothetical protein